MRYFVIITLLLILSSCSANKSLSGLYRSNKAELGFFITELNFTSEKDFEYKFSGDLQHTQLAGTYKIDDKKVYLKFNKENGLIESKSDSLTVAEMLSGNYHNYELKTEKNIDYHLKYKIKGNKLFSYRIDNGKLVRKSRSYTNSKRFFLFGSKWKTTKSYLRKLE